jgi:hypothetical protein
LILIDLVVGDAWHLPVVDYFLFLFFIVRTCYVL